MQAGTPTTISATRTISVKQHGPGILKVTHRNDGNIARENTLRRVLME